MHLLTILAFAIVLWEAEEPGRWVMTGSGDFLGTALIVIGEPVLLGFLGWWGCRHGLRMIRTPRAELDRAHEFHQRFGFALRVAALAWLAGAVFLTNWPGWIRAIGWSPWLAWVGDLMVLLPYLVTFVLLWVLAFPLERALRGFIEPDEVAYMATKPSGDAPVPTDSEPRNEEAPSWRFGTFLDFHLRHYLLVVAVPMTVILFASGLTRGYDEALTRWTGVVFAGDILVGLVAALVFVTAPLVLRYIWQTESLPKGPLRDRLETVCRRIGLRCRDILIWKSDGMMINAAVMGLLPPVRYVMLSDALLETMNREQVEAVFGHEAGHICKRHIQFFLVFAFLGWLVTATMMEAAAHAVIHFGAAGASAAMWIQVFGVVATIAFWGIGFGMLSRRFERQADLFGARCVAADMEACRLPCSVHLADSASEPDEPADRVCATGASVFASALDRVAVLNGIPHEEWSWRHSSIGSRIRFLTRLASDPALAVRFESGLRRIRRVMMVLAAVGLLGGLLYWRVMPVPAILQLQAGKFPAMVVSD